MTMNTMTCADFDERLADYLEGDIAPAERERLAAHLASCLPCTLLVRDLERIRADASALPELAPTGDLWDGIAARIDAPVLPLAARSAPVTPNVMDRRRWSERARLAAVAAALVAVTASVTYTLTASRTGGAASDSGSVVANAPPSTPGTTDPGRDAAVPASRQPADADSSAERGLQATERDATRPTALTVRNTPEGVTYSREIDRLRNIFRQNRAQLDPRTAAIIEENLKVIDDAIAQSKAALAQDPASGFLNGQLNNALDKKLELLRTAALLPSRTT